MNFFMLSKHQRIEENVLVTSKVLYDFLSKEKHIDELFLEYAEKHDDGLNLNIERILYLSLSFLFALGLIALNNNMVMRVK